MLCIKSIFSQKVSVVTSIFLCSTLPARSSDNSLEAVQALKQFAAAQSESNRLIVEYSAAVKYAKALPRGREPREPLLTNEAVVKSFLSGERETRNNRSVRNGVQYNNQILFYSTEGKPVSQFSWSFDGRTQFEINTQYDSPAGLYIGNGVTRPGSGGSLTGTELTQGKMRIVDKPTINGLPTIHVESIVSKEGVDRVYDVWLAPDRSYQAVREDIKRTVNGTEFTAVKSRKEVLNFIKFRTIWLPQKWVECSWALNRQKEAYYKDLEYDELLKVQTLSSTQKSVFSLDFPLGTVVSQEEKNTNYVEGENIVRFLEIARSKELPKELQDFLTRVVTEENVKAKTETAKQPTTKPQ